MPIFHQGRVAAILAVIFITSAVWAQSTGNSGSISGSVVDPTGAVVANATIEIRNPVSGFDRTTTTDASGKFLFTNIPFNNYHLAITAEGFAPYVQDVEPRSSVPVNVAVKLQVASSTTQVTVEAEGGDLVENDSTSHTDVDKSLFDRLPLESASSSLSSLVTLATPGVAADSNGLFHGLGDHAENSFSVDDQPITDQQSKVFSNQVPVDSIESLEVIDGAPPAEYGGKTSAHEILPQKTQALSFVIGGASRFAHKVEHPGSLIPQRSYLRSSLDEMRGEITAALADAATETWEGA